MGKKFTDSKLKVEHKMSVVPTKIFNFGVSKIYELIFRHMFRWIPFSKPVTNGA